MIPGLPHATHRHSFLAIFVLIVAGVLDPLWGLLVRVTDWFCRPALPARADTPRRRRRGLTLVLGGIEGPSRFNVQMVRGILRSGYRGSVVRFDWSLGPPIWRSWVNLTNTRHHARQADRLVESIGRYRAEYPGAPVSLVAQSGGCWIAVRALERLPETIRADTVVLLAPSISPGYDLRAAAGRCDGALVSVGSAGDVFFLGLGTLLLGTSDRVFSPSAGLVGWRRRVPRLVEMRWRWAWVRFGYFGNHTTSAAPGFVEVVVGPLLRRGQPAGVLTASRIGG